MKGIPSIGNRSQQHQEQGIFHKELANPKEVKNMIRQMFWTHQKKSLLPGGSEWQLKKNQRMKTFQQRQEDLQEAIHKKCLQKLLSAAPKHQNCWKPLICAVVMRERMEEGDIVTTPTVVQQREEPTTEAPPADDDDDESSSSSNDDADDESDDDDDDGGGEDLFNIEELQEIYKKQRSSKSKESEPMEKGHEEMDTSKVTEEPEKLVKPKAVPTKLKTTPMVRVKKSERPRVEKSIVPTFHIPEPVMTRARGKEKTCGE